MFLTRLRFRSLVLVFVLFSLGGCLVPGEDRVIRGELHGLQRWQGTVYLRGDVVLAADAELIIAPGTRVLFLPPQAGEDLLTGHPYFPGSELIVRGTLLAAGTANQPILFQSADPQAAPASWGGINIEDSERAVFDYCSFQQADSALHARRSWVSVENSHFFNNLVGIRFHDTDFLIEKNLLQNNGAAIRFHFGSPVICKNVIRNNGKGLFITSAPWGYTIENNSFINNRPWQVSLGEGVLDPVMLKNNFWGEDVAALLPNYLYDGRKDDWLGEIRFQPLRSTPDNSAGILWNR